MERYATELAAVRSERVERDAVRNLRSEQDSAYERSLATDRERARKRREEQAAAAEADKRAAQEAEDEARKEELKKQWKIWRASTLEPEPAQGTPGSVRVAIKLPGRVGGQRIVRRFSEKATLEELYAFVECHHLDEPVSGLDGGSGDGSGAPEKPKGYVHEYEFAIASILPRVVFEPSETDTVREAIGGAANLIVEDLRDEVIGATMVLDDE
jgi:FAS-associated factor 2